MMPGYPFFGPFNFRKNYYNSQYNKGPFPNNKLSNTYSYNNNLNNNNNIGNNKYNSFHKEPQNFKNVEGSNSSCNKNYEQEKENRYYEQSFELFGIRLYFDDLLILALLFFLYKEDSHDDYLYIILFMLLLG